MGVHWTPCGLILLGLPRLVQVEAWSSLVGVKQVVQGWRPLPRACKTCTVERLVGAPDSPGLETPPWVSETCQSETLEQVRGGKSNGAGLETLPRGVLDLSK